VVYLGYGTKVTEDNFDGSADGTSLVFDDVGGRGDKSSGLGSSNGGGGGGGVDDGDTTERRRELMLKEALRDAYFKSERANFCDAASFAVAVVGLYKLNAVDSDIETIVPIK
jgi:hypothetical protein